MSLREEPEDDDEKCWHAMFDRVQQHFESSGKTWIPTRARALCTWAQKQRERFQNGEMSTTQEELLRSIGFKLELEIGHDELLEDEWLRMFDGLKAFYGSNGPKPIPSHVKCNDKKLSCWAATQRRGFRRGKLSAAREQLLRSIDFNLGDLEHNSISSIPETDISETVRGDIGDSMSEPVAQCLPEEAQPKTYKITTEALQEQWLIMFEGLKEFYEQHDIAEPVPVNTMYRGMYLDRWVHRQRRNYRDKKISSTRLDLLRSINFQFVVSPKHTANSSNGEMDSDAVGGMPAKRNSSPHERNMIERKQSASSLSTVSRSSDDGIGLDAHSTVDQGDTASTSKRRSSIENGPTRELLNTQNGESVVGPQSAKRQKLGPGGDVVKEPTSFLASKKLPKCLHGSDHAFLSREILQEGLVQPFIDSTSLMIDASARDSFAVRLEDDEYDPESQVLIVRGMPDVLEKFLLYLGEWVQNRVHQCNWSWLLENGQRVLVTFNTKEPLGANVSEFLSLGSAGLLISVDDANGQLASLISGEATKRVAAVISLAGVQCSSISAFWDSVLLSDRPMKLELAIHPCSEVNESNSADSTAPLQGSCDKDEGESVIHTSDSCTLPTLDDVATVPSLIADGKVEDIEQPVPANVTTASCLGSSSASAKEALSTERNSSRDLEKESVPSHVRDKSPSYLVDLGQRKEYEVSFSSRTPLGFYCSTSSSSGVGGRRCCLVLSVDPAGQATRDCRIIPETRIVSARLTDNSSHLISSHHDIRKLYFEARRKKSDLMITFVNQQTRVQRRRPQAHQWSAKGEWRGSNTNPGWAGGASVPETGSDVAMPPQPISTKVDSPPSLDANPPPGPKIDVQKTLRGGNLRNLAYHRPKSVVASNRVGTMTSGVAIPILKKPGDPAVRKAKKSVRISDEPEVCAPEVSQENLLQHAIEGCNFVDFLKLFEDGMASHLDSPEAFTDMRPAVKKGLNRAAAGSTQERDWSMKDKVLKLYIKAVRVIQAAKAIKHWLAFDVGVLELSNLPTLDMPSEAFGLSAHIETIAHLEGEQELLSSPPGITYAPQIHYKKVRYGMNYNPALTSGRFFEFRVSACYRKGGVAIDLGSGVLQLSDLYRECRRDGSWWESEILIAPPATQRSSVSNTCIRLRVGARRNLDDMMQLQGEKKKHWLDSLKTIEEWIYRFNQDLTDDEKKAQSLSANIRVGRMSILHAAVMLEDIGSVRRLLALGADPWIKCPHGGSPLSFAINMADGQVNKTDANESAADKSQHRLLERRSRLTSIVAILHGEHGEGEEASPLDTASAGAAVPPPNGPVIPADPVEDNLPFLNHPLWILDPRWEEFLCSNLESQVGCPDRSSTCPRIHVQKPWGYLLESVWKESEKRLPLDRYLYEKYTRTLSVRNKAGRLWHTAGFSTAKGYLEAKQEVIFAEGGSTGRRSEQNIWWYPTEVDALASLKRTVIASSFADTLSGPLDKLETEKPEFILIVSSDLSEAPAGHTADESAGIEVPKSRRDVESLEGEATNEHIDTVKPEAQSVEPSPIKLLETDESPQQVPPIRDILPIALDFKSDWIPRPPGVRDCPAYKARDYCNVQNCQDWHVQASLGQALLQSLIAADDELVLEYEKHFVVAEALDATQGGRRFTAGCLIFDAHGKKFLYYAEGQQCYQRGGGICWYTSEASARNSMKSVLAAAIAFDNEAVAHPSGFMVYI